MRDENKVWSMILDKIYEAQKEIIDKIVSSISLEEPYSAPVTTILHCYTRALFDKKYGLYKPIPTNINMLLGLLFDFTIKVALQGYPPPDHYYVKEFVDGGGVKYKIHAGPDVVLDDEVVELKYTSMPLDKIPLEHHELQLKIYMNILGKNGRLVYLTPYGVREIYYSAEEALSDEGVAKIAREFFIEKKSPRYEWECQYCLYKSLCPLAWKKTEEEKEVSAEQEES